MQNEKKMFNTRKMVLLALFCALAFACQFIFRIKVSFLSFDAKDAIMTVAAMIFGPIPGLVMAFVVSFLEFITISDTGIYGLIMNFTSSAAFVCLSALVYKHKRTMTGAILALCTACAATVVTVLAVDLLVIPLYIPNMDAAGVARMIPTLLLPFNLTKTLLNAGLVLILYRPITVALRKAHMISGGEASFRMNRKSVLVLIGGLILIAACVTVFLVLLGGTFQLHA